MIYVSSVTQIFRASKNRYNTLICHMMLSLARRQANQVVLALARTFNFCYPHRFFISKKENKQYYNFNKSKTIVESE